MAGVPQNTLNWLYDVLKREYRDPNRTYSDLAQTLAQHPSLAPRTDVYTSENGASALLLNLKGTLPVNFRGTVYRFPIAIWVPHAYPYEPPTVHVTPTDDMVVRPGQHVSASDGKVYHHYLARWNEAWDKSNTIEFLQILAEVFSREPPVMAKPQQMPPRLQQQQHQGGPPPIPPTPQDQRRYSSQPPLPGTPGRTAPSGQSGPPLPPPKQTAGTSRPGPAGPPSPAPKLSRYDAPPPLPQPAQTPQPPLYQQAYANGTVQPAPNSAQYAPQRTSSLRQEYSSREQPLVPHQYQPQSPSRPGPSRLTPVLQAPEYSQYGPASQPQAQPQSYPQTISSPPPSMNPAVPPPSQLPYQQAQQVPQSQPAAPARLPYNQPPVSQQPQQLQHQPPPPNWQQQRPPQPSGRLPQPQIQTQAQAQQPKPATQPKDLLSESDPFQVSLPTTSTSNMPAPPIPTNPEKTALLSHLSHLILQHLHTQIESTQNTALPSLSSQHSALTSASQTLTSELHALQTLSQQLSSNISALQSTLTNANQTIQSTQDPKHPSHADNIPSIDQIIIPPTVVARQLYDAVAEQRGYEAAIFALNEAFVRGRIGAEVWGRKMRECAREEMRRKWLVRKIGEGLGLEEH